MQENFNVLLTKCNIGVILIHMYSIGAWKLVFSKTKIIAVCIIVGMLTACVTTQTSVTDTAATNSIAEITSVAEATTTAVPVTDVNVQSPQVSEMTTIGNTNDWMDYPVQTATVTAYTTYKDFFDDYTENVWDIIPYDFTKDTVDELLVVHNTVCRATLLYKTDGKVTVLPFEGHNGRICVDANGNILSIDDQGDTYGTYGYMLASIYAWNGEQYNRTQTANRDSGYVEYDDDGNVIEDKTYYGQAYIDGVAVTQEDFEAFMTLYAEDVTAKMAHVDTRISIEELAAVIANVEVDVTKE